MNRGDAVIDIVRVAERLRGTKSMEDRNSREAVDCMKRELHIESIGDGSKNNR